MKDKNIVCRVLRFFRPSFCIAAGFLIINMYGCTFSGSYSVSENREENRETQDMEEESAFNVFSVSENSQTGQIKSPKVLVGLNGYGPDDEKTAFFLDGEEGGAFFVVDAATRETVYTGEMIASGQSTSKGKALLKGDFTAVSKEGTYYIEAPFVGRSYTFGITGDYLEILRENLMEVLQKEAESAEGVYLYRVQTLSWILRCEEFYGEKKAVTVSAQLPEMLNYAKGLGDNLIEKKEEILSPEERAFYCGAMAELYKALKPYDERGARTYLREAEAAYQQLERQQYEAEFDRVWIFYGASALYNATGNVVYHNVFKNYLKDVPERNLFAEGAKEEQIIKDEAYIYGVVAYLTNTYGVDVDLCNRLMEDLLEVTRSIGAEYNDNPYLCVSRDLRNRVLSDRLYTLAVAEYAILSKEYVQIMKEGIHYIDGCNETGVSLLTKEGIWDPDRDEKESGAAISGAYLFVLGEIMERETVE